MLRCHYRMAVPNAISSRRKISFAVDFAKVDAARSALGTHSLTDTIDAPLDEVIKLRDRHELVEMLFAHDRLDLDDAEVMAQAWR